MWTSTDLSGLLSRLPQLWLVTGAGKRKFPGPYFIVN